jgi:N-acetylmuramoyl-L-alanine amidase
MKIVISSGHGKKVRGASGDPVPPQLDEVDEARKMVDRVAEYLKSMGVAVVVFHDDTSTSQNQNLDTIVGFHNAQGAHDLDVSVHFNAYDGSAHGTEVLYVTQEDVASEVCDAIVEAGRFTDRGAKYRGDLAFLNGCNEPAILIETCFCDSDDDSELYRGHFDEICQAVAEVLAGEQVVKPIEPPSEAEIEEDDIPRVDVVGTVEGDVSVIINGQLLRQGFTKNPGIVDVQIAMRGEVVVSINGQDFHNKPTLPANQCKITASVFGGQDDPNNSAYEPYDFLDDESLYVALPFRIEGDRPKVRVYNRTSGEAATAEIRDIGPWNTTDAYWDTGARPNAETCYKDQTELTEGPNAGRVPSNPAGIDLSPALANKLDIDGMGEVDWEFVP